MKVQKRFANRFIFLILGIFLLANIIAFFHAYKFTHFSTSSKEKTKDPKELGLMAKIEILFTGVDMPRPENKQFPERNFTKIRLKSNKKIECWMIPAENAKGTVIVFHGYHGSKAKMLDKADVFFELGYSTMLVDFMGSGGSEGNQTTIGYMEAEQVKTCYNYLEEKGERNIYLMGTSLGAVAILKALYDYKINPDGIILECPFGSMYETTAARFRTMNVPPFPMAHLLVFWGGIQNGFWAFGHNPTEYAEAVRCPTLLMYGEQDEKVSRKEVDEIFGNLKGHKELKTYPKAGHENYLIKYRSEWIEDIKQFLNLLPNRSNSGRSGV